MIEVCKEVGAMLEARAFHPGRTARAHLAALAANLTGTSAEYRASRS